MSATVSRGRRLVVKHGDMTLIDGELAYDVDSYVTWEWTVSNAELAVTLFKALQSHSAASFWERVFVRGSLAETPIDTAQVHLAGGEKLPAPNLGAAAEALRRANRLRVDVAGLCESLRVVRGAVR